MPGQVFSADVTGRFAIKGAGAAKCAAYVVAFETKSPKLASYGGWIDGFISVTNRNRPEVFDLAPWQSTEFLARALVGFCRENPTLNFYSAVESMANKLQESALATASPVLVARNGEKAVLVYQKVLGDMQDKLQGEGLLKNVERGKFDQGTIQALLQYQKKNNIRMTGVPDQITLIKLMGER
ncbi:MAG: peptidoglycan-binding protein [Gammaproteobacteria bacterium]|nr:peptidoglycan-binding protein [Gammaproteobacteria bacterium]